MPTLLESLYYGRLIPEEQAVPKDPQYRQRSRELTEAMEAWKNRLSAEEFAELEALLDLQQEVQGMEVATAFTYGFKMGAVMIIEVHFGDGSEELFEPDKTDV
jgi:hypothetical protein